VLPLSSQKEVNEAIKAAITSSDTNTDDSDTSDAEEEQPDKVNSTEVESTATGDLSSFETKNKSNTSIAEAVAHRNVSFGKFATQWLSRQREPTSTTDSSEPKSASKEDLQGSEQIPASHDVPKDEVDVAEQAIENQPQLSTATATMNLVPRILRTTKMIFTSGSYFFSYEVDLTRRLEKLNPLNQPFSLASMDQAVSTACLA